MNIDQFNQFVEIIPKDLLDKSGSVFYSGRDAFSGTKNLYLMGLNPGGSPDKLKTSLFKKY